MADSGGRDFFISYTGVNRSWAEWIAVQLEAAGLGLPPRQRLPP
jgi:hypothetical protein